MPPKCYHNFIRTISVWPQHKFNNIFFVCAIPLNSFNKKILQILHDNKTPTIYPQFPEDSNFISIIFLDTLNNWNAIPTIRLGELSEPNYILTIGYTFYIYPNVSIIIFYFWHYNKYNISLIHSESVCDLYMIAMIFLLMTISP